MSIAATHKHHIDEQNDVDLQALLSHLTWAHGAPEALSIPKNNTLEQTTKQQFEVTSSFGLLFKAITQRKRLEIDFLEFSRQLESLTPEQFRTKIGHGLTYHGKPLDGQTPVVLRVPLKDYQTQPDLNGKLTGLGFIHTATGTPLDGQPPYALLSYRFKAS